jgi:hypothetical protein
MSCLPYCWLLFHLFDAHTSSHNVYEALLSPTGRYHEGVQPGDVSQTGQLLVLLLESVAQHGCYNQQDYCSRLDGLLDKLDGTPYSGMERAPQEAPSFLLESESVSTGG